MTKLYAWALTGALLLSGSAACDAPLPDECVPGKVVDCMCEDGAAGVSECQPTRSFGACFCDDFPPVPMVPTSTIGQPLDAGILADTGTSTRTDAGFPGDAALGDTATATITDAGMVADAGAAPDA